MAERVERRALGAWGEAAAADFLIAAGLRIEARNVRTRYGEIDLVARDGPTLVFVEVKLRRRGDFGSPALAVGWRKRQRLSRLALAYAGDRPCAMRFDIVAITLPRDGPPLIEHLPDAFEGVEPR